MWSIFIRPSLIIYKIELLEFQGRQADSEKICLESASRYQSVTVCIKYLKILSRQSRFAEMSIWGMKWLSERTWSDGDFAFLYMNLVKLTPNFFSSRESYELLRLGALSNVRNEILNFIVETTFMKREPDVDSIIEIFKVTFEFFKLSERIDRIEWQQEFVFALLNSGFGKEQQAQILKALSFN
jgi:hypothetical protein